ncbi:MAG: hypothetical protein QXF56_01705 [Candidatus Micrarchaeia archaeon]
MEEEKQLELLKNSGILSEFVQSTGGNWKHEDWEKLLERVRGENITLPPEVIGTLLEAERVAYMEKLSKSEGETAVNFEKLTLRKRRRYFEEEIKRRMR